jgi:uncharacterized protein YbcI
LQFFEEVSYHTLAIVHNPALGPNRVGLLGISMGNIRLVKDGRTKGEVESAIRNAVIKFEQEFMGRGPEDVRAFIIKDIVLVRLKGVLTPAERQLAKTAEGIEMVRRLRQTLIAQGREKLGQQVDEITGAKTTGLFTDIDTQIGERIIVFTLDQDLESVFQ